MFLFLFQINRHVLIDILKRAFIKKLIAYLRKGVRMIRSYLKIGKIAVIHFYGVSDNVERS